MDLQKELGGLWSEADLQRIPNNYLKGIHIPESSKRFLAEFGLPRELKAVREILGIELGVPPDGLLTLAESSDEILGLSIDELTQFLKIGMMDDSPICIMDANNGLVVSVYAEDGSTVFLNSSVEQFVAFLGLVEKYIAEGVSLRSRFAEEEVERKYRRLLLRMEKDLRQIDQKAFQSAESWWAEVVEQMSRGER